MSETNSAEPMTYPRRISARLRQSGSILLVAHDRPDGDALGAMMAVALAARAAGKTARVVCGDVPRHYRFLVDGEDLVAPADAPAAAERCDRLLIVDTCTLGQLTEVRDTIASQWPKLMVMDHHRTSHDIAPIRWLDPTAAAAGVMAAELLADLGWPLTVDVARALMTAVCSDTGWLRFSNTDSRALAVVGRCIDAGVCPDALYRQLYQNDRPERLALLGRALAGMQLHADGRVAVMTLSADDFAAADATSAETENLINEPMRIGSVDVSILLAAHGDVIRGSLRSKPSSAIDVAAVAGQLGGGGHARAAGFRHAGPLDQAAAAILAAVAAAIG